VGRSFITCAAFALLCLGVVATAGQEPLPVAPVAPPPPPFGEWLAGVREEALSRGIRPAIVEDALAGVEAPVAQIVERDRTQAEFTLDLDQYLKRRLTRPTIRTAQQMLTRHRPLLNRVARKYGVDARVVVSVWGLESNFGRFAGVRPTIPALVTLAYDPRRATMFRQELFNALEILNNGDIELARLKGSWAGALGQPQFMPSSYLEYAQDFDGDGRRDIWSSLPDVFASVAYYLQRHGWDADFTWGREVSVPAAARARVREVPGRAEGCRAVKVMTVPLPLPEWKAMGVRTAGGGPLPGAGISASLLEAGTRTFLLYGNYEALLGYNCAHSYALSVGLLANAIK
jgi:membrane-bound lytic murein transglycosylase B